MSLKSKTTGQILDDYWNTPPYSAHKKFIEKLNKEWVPLEELREKMEVANKILAEMPEPVSAHLPSINDLQITYHQEELRQWRIRLRDALILNQEDKKAIL
jgi:hypothetical protein